jgi:hypothetical protein
VGEALPPPWAPQGPPEASGDQARRRGPAPNGERRSARPLGWPADARRPVDRFRIVGLSVGSLVLGPTVVPAALLLERVAGLDEVLVLELPALVWLPGSAGGPG